MTPNPSLPGKYCANTACREIFMPTRPNHLYCTLKCKSIHNNAQAAERRYSMKKGFKSLQGNYTILSRLYYQYKEQSLDQNLLELMGFETEFFTGLKKVRGKTVYLIFDLGYEIDSTNTFKIRKYA